MSVFAAGLKLDVNGVDYAILAIYFSVVLGIGFAARRSVSTSLDFFCPAARCRPG
jgi:SSS family solute:Na+ symporter